MEDSFKDEYDRQLAAWRAEAEITRAKAERTRAEWEIRRKAEEEEEQQRVAAEEARREEKRESTLAGWETVSPTDDSKPVHGASAGGGIGTSDEQAAAQRVSAAQEAARQHVQTFGVDAQTPEPSPTDARDLVSGERPRSSGISGLSVCYAIRLGTMILTIDISPIIVPKIITSNRSSRTNHTSRHRLRDVYIRGR